MNYHVRVLIPCYREPLNIVSKTILAAHDAVLPAGCQCHVYVCDDGRDPKIKKFCRSLGPSVTYVSGRRREAGEMNGKSGNLNNCLSQVYPEGVPIPPQEVVCVFDADQVGPERRPVLLPCWCAWSSSSGSLVAAMHTATFLPIAALGDDRVVGARQLDA